jgi:hypothetical protein
VTLEMGLIIFRRLRNRLLAAQRQERGDILARLHDRIHNFSLLNKKECHRNSAPLGVFSSQHQTRRGRLGDQLSILIGNFAFYVADCRPSPDYFALGFQHSFPDWPEIIDFQLNRSETFFRTQSACECDPHSSVGNVAEYPAVKRTHGIGMLRSGSQCDNRCPWRYHLSFKSNQARNRHILRALAKICRVLFLRITHEFPVKLPAMIRLVVTSKDGAPEKMLPVVFLLPKHSAIR